MALATAAASRARRDFWGYNPARPVHHARMQQQFADRVRHDEQGERFVIENEGRQSFLEYRRTGTRRMNLVYTFVPVQDRGQGIAAALVRAVLDYARQNHQQLVVACSYVQHYMDQHPEFNDLVAN
jgi:predicted GNAT family acetyltransferase